MLIAIDHGNKVKNHAPFTSGLRESDTPPFGGETLKYQGKYYTLSEKRVPYHRDKTEDERFFILSLFAIAYEIEAAGAYTSSIMRIQLVFVGGGAVLLKRQIEASGKVANPVFVEDIRANVKGFELLYNIAQESR